MLPLQEISDRVEIQDLLARYSHAIDDQDFEALDRVFTPDAIIDYSELGGSKGTLEETKGFLREAMPRFPGFQHAAISTKLDFDGDTAKARSVLFNPMIVNHEGQEHVFFIGLWYRDELVRTADGWRIRNRREEKSWSFNAPPGMLP